MIIHFFITNQMEELKAIVEIFDPKLGDCVELLIKFNRLNDIRKHIWRMTGNSIQYKGLLSHVNSFASNISSAVGMSNYSGAVKSLMQQAARARNEINKLTDKSIYEVLEEATDELKREINQIVNEC